LKGLIFGARLERSTVVCAEQLAFDLGRNAAETPPPANDGNAAEGAASAGKSKRAKARRNIGALPAYLPRCEQVIEPASTLCPCCAGQMHRIGEDVSEALDRAPARLRVLRTIRPKYAFRACEGPIVQAAAPARLIEGGMATTALIAHIAAAKYAWQSTLYRQTQILAGWGFVVDRQTLARWMKSAAWIAKSLYELQLKTMHGFARLFCDETPMPVLDPGRGRTKVCQFWAHATDDRAWRGPAPPAVAYVFAGSRDKAEIETQLSDFSGLLQVDGYAAYKPLARRDPGKGQIVLAFCLAHARRKFVAAWKTTKSPFAKEVIEAIGAVYAIEKRVRGAEAAVRRQVRQAESRPILETLYARLAAMRDGLSRTSPLTKAIDYALNHWSGLVRFLDDGRLEPGANVVERQIRPISIGRKNSLFSGDEGGGETWAILSSLVNTARLNGLDPEAYLSDVLERMVSGRTTNDRLHELLAWNWRPEGEATPPAEAAALNPPPQGKEIGSGAVSASAESAWIASRINRSVVSSK
jgi:transposase